MKFIKTVDVKEKPLLVIVGATASGKTALAVDLAQKLNGEIIAADSRTIYKEMNIGTAKPTLAEQTKIKHWGIDLVDPDVRFTAADFQKYANEKIADICERRKMPILVGGSGLYVDSVIFNYQFGEKVNDEYRSKLNNMSISELQNYCKNNNILLPENNKNKRYLVRSIERNSVVKNTHKQLRKNTIVVGLKVDKIELRRRISERIENMFQLGIEAETRQLIEKYSWELESMKSNIYQFIAKCLCGELSRAEAIKLAEIDDWHLAKKQMTWFRRNKHILWLDRNDAEKYLIKLVKNKR